MNHSLNEMGSLNCRILKKKTSAKRWSKLGHISDYHSGSNDRKFRYDRRLDDGYFTDRFLHVSFELNSWDYEIEDPATGEYKSYQRNGSTRITFKIEDRTLLSTTVKSSNSTTVSDMAKLQLAIHDPNTNISYRFICDERP